MSAETGLDLLLVCAHTADEDWSQRVRVTIAQESGPRMLDSERGLALDDSDSILFFLENEEQHGSFILR